MEPYTHKPNQKKWCDKCKGRPKPEYNLATLKCPDCDWVYCVSCADSGCCCQSED